MSTCAIRAIIFAVIAQCCTGLVAALELSEGLVTIYHNAEDSDLAVATLSIVEDGLMEYGRRLPPGTEPIVVHICHSREEFEKLGGPLRPLQVSGFARSREGIVVLKTPRLLPANASYAGIVRHEILHILLARNTGPGYLPRWLNEGVAMTLSREMRWGSYFRVGKMYALDRIVPYENLSRAFAAPGNEIEFGDAYAQSLSMTTFLREKIGDEVFWSMMEELNEKPFSEALEEYTGLIPEALYDEWRASLWQFALVSSIVSGIGVFQIMALLLVLAYFRKRRLGAAIVKTWDEEEDEDEILFPSDLEGREPPYPWEDEED